MTKLETRDNLKTLEAQWMDKRETLFMYRAYSADGELPGTRSAMDQVIKQEADASKVYHAAIDELIDGSECIAPKEEPPKRNDASRTIKNAEKALAIVASHAARKEDVSWVNAKCPKCGTVGEQYCNPAVAPWIQFCPEGCGSFDGRQKYEDKGEI